MLLPSPFLFRCFYLFMRSFRLCEKRHLTRERGVSFLQLCSRSDGPTPSVWLHLGLWIQEVTAHKAPRCRLQGWGGVVDGGQTEFGRSCSVMQVQTLFCPQLTFPSGFPLHSGTSQYPKLTVWGCIRWKPKKNKTHTQFKATGKRNTQNKHCSLTTLLSTLPLTSEPDEAGCSHSCTCDWINTVWAHKKHQHKPPSVRWFTVAPRVLLLPAPGTALL